MDIPIAVVDAVPAYRQGLIAALADAGFEAEAVDDVVGWAKGDGRRAVLIGVASTEISAVLAAVRSLDPDLVIVALVQDLSTSGYSQALRGGASGVVAWNETPETIIDALHAGLENDCLLPISVVRALTLSGNPTTGIPAISLWEVRWLQMLADGATVAELAREASYSEREMFRLLNGLYHRMGARNRVEAMVLAARAGLLGVDSDMSPP